MAHDHSHEPSHDHGESSRAPIVGIDLGTTNSLVAWVRDGKPEVLATPDGNRLIPSVVSFDEGKPVIGQLARKRKIRGSGQTVYSVKRLLGRGFEDLKQSAGNLPYRIVSGQGTDPLVRIEVGGATYTAIEISAMILREARQVAEQALGQTVTQAVITVPAYFNDSQRQATRAAGRLAGLDVLRIVNEPTAAALAYGLASKGNGLIAVYDLGGGTFDLSILKLHDGIFEVLATHGDTQLGGDDLDWAVVVRMAEAIRAERGQDPLTSNEGKARLIEAAEQLKFALAEREQARFVVELPGSAGRFERVVTRDEFESWVLPILERTAIPCRAALADAGISASELTDVVLVGGPTRLRVVQQVARGIFGREPNTSLHPDEVVAVGAAIQADILAGNNREFLLLDVVPLSLGIETYGGVMSPLIPRNTKVPAVSREFFTNFVENQTAVDVHVLQGERERVEDNRSLARFKLKGIPPMPAGQARIEVTFLVDADGILQVSAKDLRTGNEQVVEVKPSFGLSDSEVERMLADQQSHAIEDLEFRRLVDVRTKAEPILRATEKQMDQARRLLPPAEFDRVERGVGGLRLALEGRDPEAIQNASYELKDATTRLAELIIRETIEGIRQGK